MTAELLQWIEDNFCGEDSGPPRAMLDRAYRAMEVSDDLLAALEDVATTLDKWKGQAYTDLAAVARKALAAATKESS